ncbi:MAG: DnaD domain protein [Clostridia bacterium]|nr:DnaD domain protein [Clostridia bacterium]
MALCSFSSTLAMDNSTLVDNAFINEFLPAANEKCLKVYLYGLSLCSSPYSRDNAIDSMANALGLSIDDIIDAFSYWQEMGIVQIMTTDPISVQFLPVRLHSGRGKTQVKEKYADFNKQAQSILSGRMIRPNEYNEYYNLIESYHFEPEALLMIISYCAKLKNNSINYPYILAVANSFEKEGIKTTSALEEKLLEQEQAVLPIGRVLSSLGVKREADLDERNLYIKWTKVLGFTEGTIVEVAKTLKKRGGMHKLDELLTKYFEQKLFTMQEIASYSELKEKMFGTAKLITKNIGVYYQNLEGVVETYISDWTSKGYDDASLELISKYCFKQSVRTLEGMNTVVQKFFKLGLVSIDAINEYLEEVIATDNIIKNILETVGLSRSVSAYDRDLFKTWSDTWNLPVDVIMLASCSAKEKVQPIIYLNKLLSSLHLKNITTLDAAKSEIDNFAKSTSFKPSESKPKIETREYTSTELNALFDSLDDIEV